MSPHRCYWVCGVSLVLGGVFTGNDLCSPLHSPSNDIDKLILLHPSLILPPPLWRTPIWSGMNIWSGKPVNKATYAYKKTGGLEVSHLSDKTANKSDDLKAKMG